MVTMDLSDTKFANQLLEHLVVPTFVLAASGHVIIWNRACEKLTGVCASAVLGTKRHWAAFYEDPRPCLADLVLEATGSARIEALYTVDRSDWRQLDGEAKDGRFSILAAENWCVLPNGSGRRYLAIDAGPVFDQSGALMAVVETLRDITPQKNAQDALETLASQDGLTGLANRRRFDEHLKEEWLLAINSGTELSLLMLDIDHFKPYNDSSGHQRGDECLRQVAKLLVAETRQDSDLVARYGGEEFVVVLPGASYGEAMKIARRILATMRDAAIPHPAPSCPMTVTLSIGVATKGKSATSLDQLIAVADASLYRAKQSGRNRIVANFAAAA
ncbi:sensor domain-containing diguanylate cyclase [Aurantimonas sp. E1-2-R+4]|uniref:sensor domain-containing diguanylate cyclase n=1 Tax=Aurantimonas sp. E1-2-R+4 TaxID=3113714 RepID=UPI002F92B254